MWPGFNDRDFLFATSSNPPSLLSNVYRGFSTREVKRSQREAGDSRSMPGVFPKGPYIFHIAVPRRRGNCPIITMWKALFLFIPHILRDGTKFTVHPQSGFLAGVKDVPCILKVSCIQRGTLNGILLIPASQLRWGHSCPIFRTPPSVVGRVSPVIKGRIDFYHVAKTVPIWTAAVDHVSVHNWTLYSS